MTEKKAKNVVPAKLNALQKLDDVFEGRQQLILWLSLAITFIFGLLLFEPKVSLGGDDSMYINRAYNFIHDGAFPAFQGPLFPMVVGVLITIVGVNLIALKFFSLVCLLIHQWFIFRLFRNYLSPFTLFLVMLLISTSASILYYGSATYNEAFYMAIQSIFLFRFDRSFIRNSEEPFSLRRDYRKLLLSGFLLFLLTITKNIGLVAVIAVAIYFLLIRRWKFALAIVGAFAIFTFSFSILKSTAWEIQEAQISNQGSTLLLKNPYKPDLGNEDAYGYWLRLVRNSQAYLGYHFIHIFGMSKEDNYRGYPIAAVLIYALAITGFFSFYKKSRFWLFIGIFLATAFGTTFLVLQTYWNQERLVIVFTPLLLIYLVHILYYLFTNSLKKYATALVVFLAIFAGANLFKLFTTIPRQVEVISKYMQGEKYYGFTEDWINYLNMAKWVRDNLPENAYVGCRKPGMAFIYSGGKDFYGIWKVPSNDPEDLYNRLKERGVTHVIMANIRTNPDDPNSRIINTVRRYLSIINQAYPGKLKLVHQVGENWPAYLYELN